MDDCPKYIGCHPKHDEFFLIETEEDLQHYLKDGSLGDGDIVFSVAQSCTVRPSDPSLVLKFKAERKEYSDD